MVDALQVFIVDEVGDTLPLELSPDATVGVLRDEIASIKHVNPQNLVISYQNKELTDMSIELAETGISNECLLSVKHIDFIIELSFERSFEDNHRFMVRPLHLNGSDVFTLKCDTRKDLTQHAWIDSMDIISAQILQFDEEEQLTRRVMYKPFSSAPASFRHHLFFIAASHVRNESESAGGLSSRQTISAFCLQKPENAKDIWFAPSHKYGMLLIICFVNHDQHGLHSWASYRAPTGYGLLLKHRTTVQQTNNTHQENNKDARCCSVQ